VQSATGWLNLAAPGWFFRPDIESIGCAEAATGLLDIEGVLPQLENSHSARDC
jgi:hypothetical protein